MPKSTSVERFTRTGTKEYLSSMIEEFKNNCKLLPDNSLKRRLIQEQVMFVTAAIDFLSNAELEETYVQSTFTQQHRNAN